MTMRDRLRLWSPTGVSLSPHEGGEGRREERRVSWISPLPGPLPTPPSWGEGIHRAVSHFPQSSRQTS